MSAIGRWSGRAAGILAPLLALAAVTAGALLLLSPAAGPAPIDTAPRRWFDPGWIERAESFRDGQQELLLIGAAAQLAVLVLLLAARPVRRLLGRAGRRPLLGGAAAGAAIAVLLALAALPTGLLAHRRAVDAGLSTQETAAWLADRGLSTLVAIVPAALGAVLLLALQRRLPRLWWTVASALVVAYAVLVTWLAPVVLAPLFNDFEPLERGRARAEILDLSRRAGVDVGGAYRVDASRRGTALNAYVVGIGSSRRVVVYDNLLAHTGDAELRAVIAHELGHVAHRDLWRGLLFVALVAPPGMLFASRLGAALAGRSGARPGTPAALPAYVLAIVLTAGALGLAGNALSRAVEASADRFALRLTGDPSGFIELQRKLATTNLSDPDPDGPLDRLLRTHPTTIERIGAALAARRGQAAAGAPGP